MRAGSSRLHLPYASLSEEATSVSMPLQHLRHRLERSAESAKTSPAVQSLTFAPWNSQGQRVLQDDLFMLSSAPTLMI